MAIFDRLSSNLGRNDEAPNIALADEIVAGEDRNAVIELVSLLSHNQQAVRSDALKVLYEVGTRDATLIEEHWSAFLNLLSQKNNRMIWGAMEAIATVSPFRAQELAPHLHLIKAATKDGSVITRDWGVRALAQIAVSVPEVRQETVRFLLRLLEGCRESEFPRHAASVAALMSTDESTLEAFRRLCHQRTPGLSKAQNKRVESIIRSLPKP